MAPRIALLSSITAFVIIVAVSDVDAQDGASNEPARLFTQAYPAADLVLATPGGIGVLSLDKDIKMSYRPDDSQPDFQPLIDEITSAIEPDSWKSAGGPGIVAGEPKTLSLVVRQTQEVHDQIADLIRRMRRELDTQITLEVRRLEVPETFLESIDDLDVKDRAKLDEKGMKSLMVAVQSHTQANLLSAPKVTLFQGHALWIHESKEGAESSLVLQPTISKDRRSVKLSLAATGRVDGQRGILSETARLKTGETLLLDCGAASDAAQRELLLITPRVIIAEENEELLSHSAE